MSYELKFAGRNAGTATRDLDRFSVKYMLGTMVTLISTNLAQISG